MNTASHYKQAEQNEHCSLTHLNVIPSRKNTSELQNHIKFENKFMKKSRIRSRDVKTYMPYMPEVSLCGTLQ